MARIPSEKFEEILRLVWSHLVAANGHLTIWEELRSTPDRERLCDTYSGFFHWTRDAHIDRFIHKICVVTDTDKSQPSIHKLANIIQADPSVASGIDFKTVLGRLDHHAQVQYEIRAVRDTRSSHWDMSKKPPEPEVAKCRELLKELNAILEDLWNAHRPSPTGGRNSYSLTPIEHSHTAYILDKLTGLKTAG